MEVGAVVVLDPAHQRRAEYGAHPEPVTYAVDVLCAPYPGVRLRPSVLERPSPNGQLVKVKRGAGVVHEVRYELVRERLRLVVERAGDPGGITRLQLKKGES